MDITLQASETLFSLNIGGRLFTCTPADSMELEAALRDAAEQLRAARGRLSAEAFARKRARPDFWPEWTLAQGLTALTRDGYLTDPAVIRILGKFVAECGPSYQFSWLTWLGQTWNFDRFRAAIPGLGDKRIRILRAALVEFLARHPDRIYTGSRLP